MKRIGYLKPLRLVRMKRVGYLRPLRLPAHGRAKRRLRGRKLGLQSRQG